MLRAAIIKYVIILPVNQLQSLRH